MYGRKDNVKRLELKVYTPLKLIIIDKALNKFKKPKHCVSHFDLCLNPIALLSFSSIPFKIFKFLSQFGFKVSFKPVNKIKLSSLKDPIPTENWSDTYLIP